MRRILLFAFLAVAVQTYFFPHSPAVERKSATAASAISVATTASKSKKPANSDFESTLESLYDQTELQTLGLGYEVFRLAMVGYYSLKSEGVLSDKELITIIDFSKPSTEKRFYTIDLLNKQVKYHTYVAHGRNSGENFATKFSNTSHSNQSSLGFQVTGETYVGSKGFSLRLDGVEESFNDKVRSRAVVIHAADYVSEQWIERYGRLGRSQGCPALPPALNKEIINAIRNKTAVFTYYPDKEYLETSRYLKVGNLHALPDTPLKI